MTTDHSTHEHAHDGSCLDGSGATITPPAPEPSDFTHAVQGTGPYAPPHTPAHLAAQATSYAEADAFASGQIPEGRHMVPIAALPPSEFLMSLNGFDEIAIAARFGTSITALRNDPIAAGRAMAFVHYRRAGANDHDAHQSALGLTLREVSEFFQPEPVSAEGNDDAAQ